MSFEIPRLRVLAAKIWQNYAAFQKKPAPFLNGLYKDLLQVNPELASACEALLASASHAPAGRDVAKNIDDFVNELRLFLAANADAAFDPNEEIFL
ncbi:MAG: hypothetical protein LBV04_02245, partial [Deferribacteraceae bacterium]|nr:hypothetical protein [Deferribacteraceae bacterium]